MNPARDGQSARYVCLGESGLTTELMGGGLLCRYLELIHALFPRIAASNQGALQNPAGSSLPLLRQGKGRMPSSAFRSGVDAAHGAGKVNDA